MWGHYSYLFSILFFAGPAILIEWIGGRHILKKYKKTIYLGILVALLFAPADGIAYIFNSWKFNPQLSFNILILGTVLESYIASLAMTLAVSFAIIIWTNYEDEGKNILRQSWKDLRKRRGKK